MSDQYDLTQAGLEEYNTRNAFYDHQNNQLFNHQKQSSYAQSEGYHSYVSSSDSSSTTPFLDRLRQESELLTQNKIQCQNDGIFEDTDIQSDHNCADSTSSTETLKWLGSGNDDSEGEVSTKYSTISESTGASKLIAHSSRVTSPKRYRSESLVSKNTKTETRTNGQQQQCLTNSSSNDPSVCPQQQLNFLSNKSNLAESKDQTAVEQENSKILPLEKIIEQRFHENIKNVPNSRSSLTVTSIPFYETSSSTTITKKNNIQTDTQETADGTKSLNNNNSNDMKINSTSSITTKHLPARTNFRLFPINTYTKPNDNNNQANFAPPNEKKTFCTVFEKFVPPQKVSNNIKINTQSNKESSSQNWQSVADRISDFERGQNHPVHHYTFLEPSKTHRISNPALKAIQKTAVQSYFERQQREHTKNLDDDQNFLLRTQSQRSYLNLPNASAQIRNSLPDNLNTPILSSLKFKDSTTSLYASNGNSHGHLNSSLNYLPQYSGDPPPPPPRSRSLLPTLLRRSSYDHTTQTTDTSTNMQEENLIRNVSTADKLAFNVCGMPLVPPPPPPRKSMASSLSCSSSYIDKLTNKNNKQIQDISYRSQYYNFGIPNTSEKVVKTKPCWAPPERPPKNPKLRVPSPELPPPPPEIYSKLSDEPLPPPPPEVLQTSNNCTNPDLFVGRNNFENVTSSKITPKVPPKIPKKPTSLKKVELDTQNTNKRKRSHNVMIANQTSSNCCIGPAVEKKFEESTSAIPPPLLPKNLSRSTGNDTTSPKNRMHSKSLEHSFQNSYYPDLNYDCYKLAFDSNENKPCVNKSKSYEMIHNSRTVSACSDIVSNGKAELQISTYRQYSQNLNCSNPETINDNPESNQSHANKTFSLLKNEFADNNMASFEPPPAGNLRNLPRTASTVQNTVDVSSTSESHFASANRIIENHNVLQANIEKITELQAKLSLSHLSESKISICEENKTKDKLQSKTDIQIMKTTNSPTENPNTDDKFLVKIGSSSFFVNEITNPQTLDSNKILEHSTQLELQNLSLHCTEDQTLMNVNCFPEEKKLKLIENEYNNVIDELLKLLPAHDNLICVLKPVELKTFTNYGIKLYNSEISSEFEDRCNSETIKSSGQDDKGFINRQNVKDYEILEMLSSANFEEMDLTSQKLVNLITTTNEIIKILYREHDDISATITQNTNLGNALLNKVLENCLPNEKLKIETYVDDIGHITSLLLALSERLAKTENALMGVVHDEVEKTQLEEKRKRIHDQLLEAKQLKELIDSRGSSINALLQKNLNQKDIIDFNSFINMKAKLITDIRRIGIKIKFREEQLGSLREALLQRSSLH